MARRPLVEGQLVLCYVPSGDPYGYGDSCQWHVLGPPLVLTTYSGWGMPRPAESPAHVLMNPYTPKCRDGWHCDRYLYPASAKQEAEWRLTGKLPPARKPRQLKREPV